MKLLQAATQNKHLDPIGITRHLHVPVMLSMPCCTLPLPVCRCILQQGDDKKLLQAASRKKKLEERLGVNNNAKGMKFKVSSAQRSAKRMNFNMNMHVIDMRRTPVASTYGAAAVSNVPFV